MRSWTLAVRLVAAAVCCLASTAAAAGPPELINLPVRSARSDVNPRDLKPPALKPGVTYAASQFPIAIRLTPPDATWAGGQGRSLEIKSRAALFGWIELVPTPSARPRGAVAIVSSYGRTGSVAATLNRLRTGGAGASYEATSPVTVAGFTGVQFDGKIGGQGHAFIPFSAREHVARFYPDSYFLDAGEVFHFDPGERHSVTSESGGRVLLLLAPWPAVNAS